MATLNFKGKSAVWNHHLSVPYHTLSKEKKSSLIGVGENENLIIEGDNLLALKALLPKYQGIVKCIYIDPPYNTGNEGWVFNDNVSNPIIKEWIGETVGKEGDDLTRHDKWLAMMTPRLKLLRELLSDDGVIFISIDENEVHHLRQLMDEIFGETNIEEIVWKKFDPKYDKNTNAKVINRTKRVHEYILLAYKDKNKTLFSKIKKLPNWLNSYSNADNDKRGAYKQGIISFEEGHEKEDKKSEYYYTITTPSGRKITRNFFVLKEEFEQLTADNRIYFPKNGDGIPAVKIFENEEKDFYFETILEGVGSLSSAKKEIAELFGISEETVFDTPKPVKLIKEILRACSDKNAIIIDSFAGSGTTAQAVIELNQEEKGSNRKFILIQLEEKIKEDTPICKYGYKYVHEITVDRVKKVIKRDKLDVGFTYYKLGPSIDGRGILEGKDLPTWENFAKYAYYLATGKPIDDIKKPSNTWEVVSKTKNTGVYLMYKDNIDELKKLAITRDWLETVKNKEGKKIVYAPACFLDKEILDEHDISFVQMPFNLFKRN